MISNKLLNPHIIEALNFLSEEGPININPVLEKLFNELMKVEQGVRISAHLTGLPSGVHGFHIHEKGDCESPDASSAGGHFNPTKEPHAGPEDLKRHLGDLGNIEANSQGEAVYDRIDKKITLVGPDSIIGRSVIIHNNRDDYKTQPTGNAGARLGCGLIQNASSITK